MTPKDKRPVDMCITCANNRPGIEAMLFCINNCVNGSKYKKEVTGAVGKLIAATHNDDDLKAFYEAVFTEDHWEPFEQLPPESKRVLFDSLAFKRYLLNKRIEQLSVTIDNLLKQRIERLRLLLQNAEDARKNFKL